VPRASWNSSFFQALSEPGSFDSKLPMLLFHSGGFEVTSTVLVTCLQADLIVRAFGGRL